MARGDNPLQTPVSNRKNPREMQSTAAKQRSLLSFFPKLGVSTPKKSTEEEEKENKNADGPSAVEESGEEIELPKPIAAKKSSISNMQSSTSGIFSSDAPSPEEQDTPIAVKSRGRLWRRSEMEPSSPTLAPSSPTGERGTKRVTYAESSGSEEDSPKAKGRASKRKKTALESEDEYAGDNAADDIDEGKHCSKQNLGFGTN